MAVSASRFPIGCPMRMSQVLWPILWRAFTPFIVVYLIDSSMYGVIRFCESLIKFKNLVRDLPWILFDGSMVRLNSSDIWDLNIVIHRFRVFLFLRIYFILMKLSFNSCDRPVKYCADGNPEFRRNNLTWCHTLAKKQSNVMSSNLMWHHVCERHKTLPLKSRTGWKFFL